MPPTAAERRPRPGARRGHGRDVAARTRASTPPGPTPACRASSPTRALGGVVARVAADRAAAFDAWPEPGDRSGPARRPASSPTPRSGPRASPTTGSPSARSSSTARCRSCGGSAPARSGSAAPSSRSAVPLLDESHLQIDARAGRRTTRAAARRRWSRRCCCGSSATSARGWCSCTSGTSGSSPGSLPGLYPLTRTGLLTVHDPGDLAGLLDELSDRIRRVHTRVLVDGHAVARGQAPDDRDRGPSRGSCGARRQRHAAGRGGAAPAPAGAARRPRLRDLRRARGRPDGDRRARGDGAAAEVAAVRDRGRDSSRTPR